MFRVVPLTLISFLEIDGNLISGLHKVVQQLNGLRILLKVLLSDVQGIELLLSVVIVGNLRESKRLSVDIGGVHLDRSLLRINTSGSHVLLYLDGSLEVSLV